MQSVTEPGRVVAGRYELLDLVGHGAMGTVWRARDLRLDREVAVKEVRVPGPMTHQDRNVLRERSLREARVAARLSHPGVVTVHDVIEAGGSPWIVMELVPSRSLAQVLAQDGPMSPARAAAMGMTLLEALGSAHAAGVVHRDVKPGNILITPEGRAVLTDFGIATLHGDPGLTQAGMVMGTPGFCAPERIRGEPASPASDLWSLGATLYAAVQGRGPFEGQGSAMAVLANIVHGDPPPATSAGPLGPVITALMKRDPAARPDAAAARRLLAAACSSCRARPGALAGGNVEDGASARSGAGARSDSVRNGPSGRNGAAIPDGASARNGAGAPDGPRAGGDRARPAGAGGSAGAGGAGASGSAGAGGDPDGTGIRDGTASPDGARRPGGTLAFPAGPPEGVAAFAGQPPAGQLDQARQPSQGRQPGLATQPGSGGQRRRPGRHRRALLFGGGGASPP